MNALTSKSIHRDYVWRSLTVFNLYRLLIAVGITTLFQSNVILGTLAPGDNVSFGNISSAYLVLALLALPFQLWRKPRIPMQIWSLMLIDIVALTLMSDLSGGPQSGLGMLLAVNITLATLILGNMSALALAGLAALAVIGEQSYAVLEHGRDSRAFAQVALIGAVYFAMASLALILSRRLRETEAEVAASRDSVAKLERLNAHIIQYMTTGVLVVDRSNRLRLLNHSAWTMLGMPSGAPNSLLDEVCIPLFKLMRQWRRNSEAKPQTFRLTPNTPELLPSFNALSPDQQLTLIFLEDTSRTTQQATQMKLASLGRLTASIAHEIRNPLGALSHAAQLLKESTEVADADMRLVEIIEKNSVRMNNIIENIMQISQRRPSQPQTLNLGRFLNNFVEEFRIGRNPQPEIQVEVIPRDLRAAFDREQLVQVLTNLCDNGLRYSIKKENRAIIELHAGEDKRSGRPVVDVIDHGEGIAPETVEKIFEPFFTTSSKGLGLGLYLARELCQANRGLLEYIPLPSGGSCFRITFAAVNTTVPTT